MVDADEDEVVELHVVGAVADAPAGVPVPVVLLRRALAVRHEALDALGDVLRQLRERDGLRRAAEVLCRDLAAPLAVPRPL